ncbi:Phospholipase/carboxylesterase [Tilletiopsis washingtonensis]|uniref:Acyl-protein thioesterase 1 n=1 Tax=Tilletiopsis washingtonensis TaxID=58919 RepID=A0A316ZIQ2_9BASI|nr:Phospholipase/carboxylesterase [Tilletiopsis washingtonensis]PWO00969.1 Phospholipase/carboxylesterase [Tilletiopsis washingtonensis]
MALLKSIILPPAGAGPATASVIFAHGLGDSGAGWLDVARMLQQRPKLAHVRFILPNAPVLPITLNGGMPMPAWFDISSLEDLAGTEDAAGMRKSADALMALVQAEADGSAEKLQQAVPSERVVLGGFSQGGAVSLLAGLTTPLRLAGLIGLSTWLPLRRSLKPSEHAASLPVLLAHGDADAVVRTEFGRKTRKYISAGGEGGAGIGCGEWDAAKVKGVMWKEYRGMGHSACADEIDDIGEYLEAVIPA